MEMQNNSEVFTAPTAVGQLRKVTPLSKYLTMALFIILPFIGGYIGYMYTPEKVVEVEKVVKVEKTAVAEGIIPGAVMTATPGFVLEPAPEFQSRYASMNVTPERVFWQQADGKKDLLKISYENCRIMSTADAVDLVRHRLDVPHLSSMISSPDNVVGGASCWVAGGGSEMYAFHYPGDVENVHLVSFTIGECGLVPNCIPYGEPILLR